MSVNEDNNNSKANNTKIKSQVYFSPYVHKKMATGNLFTEPRKIPILSDSFSKNKTRQKISNQNIPKNIINNQTQESFRKSSKFLSQTNDKSYQTNRDTPTSYSKINSKLYLKKNAIPNLSSFNDNNSKASTTQMASNSNMNTEVNNSRNNKLYKNKATNAKFNIGKNNSNYYKESSYNLKKSSGSATNLFGNSNNLIKKAKTKQKHNSDFSNININQIGYIISTTGNSSKPFLSPQSGPGQKIFFLKNDKNKMKEKYIQNISKDSVKIIPTQTNEQININNLDDKNKNGIQYLLRNTYNDVKIYPTTFLNNKIIYQTENNSNLNTNINSCNISLNFHKNKSEKIIGGVDAKNNSLNINSKYENAGTIEEVHFLYVTTIQNGKNLISKLDKFNN